MKKTILAIVLALLCLIFEVNGQDNNAIDVTTKGVQIGQMVPNITITTLHNYKDSTGKIATTARLSDFKGKLLILDFWATWCSPCVAMIPKMDSLQQQFGDKIQFMSITNQSENETLAFLKKFEKQKGKHYNLPVVTADKELHKLFPHITLPHYIWINTQGIVIAITEHQQINSINIEKILKEQDIIIERKRDMEIAYDKTKPLFMNGNGGNGMNLIAHSVLSGYTEGLPPGYTKFSKSTLNGGRIILRNLPLLWFFKATYAQKNGWIADNQIMIDVDDPSKISSKLSGNAYDEWLKSGNGYCYELLVPKSLSDSIYVYMQADLKRYFPQYEVGMEKQERTCWILKQIGENTKQLSNPEVSNADKISGDQFIRQLNNTGMLQDSKFPLINGLSSNDPRFSFDFKQNFKDITELNLLLESVNLKFIQAEKSIDILTIRDRK